MLRHKLNGMIEVSRFKNVNAAELFPGFRRGAVVGGSQQPRCRRFFLSLFQVAKRDTS